MRFASLRSFALAGVLAATVAFAPSAQADTLEFELATELSGSGGVMSGPVKVTFDDLGNPAGPVRLTIDLSAWDTSLSEYFSGLYINFSGAEGTGAWETGFAVSYVGGSNDNDEFDAVLEEFNGFKADGQGFFDVLVGFNEAGNDRLEAGETAIFDITGATLAQLNVGSVNGGNGEILIGRARGLGDDSEGSGWFTGPGCLSTDPQCGGDIPDVPEPSTMLLMGGAMLALGFIRRKRNS